MAGIIDIAGDVASAGAATGGLILVFMGSAVAAFNGYDTTAQDSVRATFRTRVWTAFVGLLLAFGATTFALIAKVGPNEGAAWTAVTLLALAALVVAAAAIFAALEVG